MITFLLVFFRSHLINYFNANYDYDKNEIRKVNGENKKKKHYFLFADE